MNKPIFKLTKLNGELIDIIDEEDLYNIDTEIQKAEIVTLNEINCCKMLINRLSFWEKLKLLLGY